MTEYRLIDYDGRWYPEVQSSHGVWQIMANCDAKEEAEKIIEKERKKMKRYKLIKDLPTFQAGDEFEIRQDGCLWQLTGHDSENHWKSEVMAYHKKTLEKFPNTLEDWFEEIENVGEWIPNRGDTYWYVDYDGDIFRAIWLGAYKDNDKASIGNVFRNEEEAKKAVEKLKAWKRLKDKGIRFELWDYNDGNYQDKIRTGRILFSVSDYKKLGGDLILLFGDEDE